MEITKEELEKLDEREVRRSAALYLNSMAIKILGGAFGDEEHVSPVVNEGRNYYVVGVHDGEVNDPRIVVMLERYDITSTPELTFRGVYRLD